MTRRPSLLLVNPRRRYRYHWDLKELCEVMHKRAAILPLALPVVAGMTPAHYDITLLDEEMEPMRFDPRPDIVGITALATSIKRGYEIADRFRAMGVPVVMGGPQVSFSVQETLRHADTVVVGEAEEIWPQCLADFERGRLKPVYKRQTVYEFRRPPRPRWDLVNTKKIMALGVQASRGCPYACEFCLVRNMFGPRHRYRDLDDLMEEIESLPKRQLGFVDDNLTADKTYARALMQRLKPLKATWSCQCSLDVTRDDALLRDMAEAGCTSLVLGIESLNPESLRETHKFQNKVKEYEDGIRRVHGHGIHVIGSFIAGFDADRPDAFDAINDFTVRNHISLIMLNVLTAYPGTDLYERLKKAGRVTDVDPDLLNGIYPTMQFRNLSQEQMYHRYFATLEKMFSPDVVLQKALHVFESGNFRHYNDADLTFLDKAACMAHLVRWLLLSPDPRRRALFTKLCSLGIRKRASMGNIVEFLLLILSFSGYLEFTRQHREEILEKIRKNDPGALAPEEPSAEACGR